MWDNDGVFELSAGQIVADKYRIDGVLGTGGMGIVVAATHIELEQRVAIKFLREVSPEALARFQREARMLVRLKSPHVARVIDVGSLDDDTPYIVMEHLDGSDLATVASERKKLPVEETVDYILQACEGIAEAHALGMVHRDLKPANLFLARGPGGTTTVKVLDFGVSKILDDRSSGADSAARGGDLTNEGVALGSPGYMSPEQMTSARDVDERSDIFSLGALLYRLVGGQAPYKGSSVVSILAVMATEKLPPLRKLTPDVPEGFAAIVERCLASDKVVRFPSVAHLAHALEPYATRRGRVSIEQILATLNVTIGDDDGLGATMRSEMPPLVTARQTTALHAAPLPTPRHTAGGRQTPPPGLPPAPELGPTLMDPKLQTPRGGRQTGPHFTVSAPAAAPPHFVTAPAAASRPSSTYLPAVVIALLILGLCGVAWRALRTPADAVVTEPSAAVTGVPVTAAATAEPTPAVTASAPEPAAPASSASGDPASRPKAVPTLRPRQHASPPHTAATTTPNGPSPPPNPADVPGGRH